MSHRSIWMLVAVALALAACTSTVEPAEEYVTEKRKKDWYKYGTVHGDPRGMVLFDSEADEEDGALEGGGTAMAVNPFLWRGALETIGFMPLAQTDPIGGVIITDWYAPPESPGERFKLNVYVLDRSLRADGLKVSVFRQVQQDGGWVDAEVEPGTAAQIEEGIVARARELRVASLENDS